MSSTRSINITDKRHPKMFLQQDHIETKVERQPAYPLV